jgi:hypothetical protein
MFKPFICEKDSGSTPNTKTCKRIVAESFFTITKLLEFDDIQQSDNTHR